MDYKKMKAPTNTVTRDMNQLSDSVGNVYEMVRIIAKRSNQIATEMKRCRNQRWKPFRSSKRARFTIAIRPIWRSMSKLSGADKTEEGSFAFLFL